MASIYGLKPTFQRLLRPLVTRLAGAGITPNQVTVAALLLSLVTALALIQVTASWVPLLLPPVLLLRMALNAIDGMLAREHGPITALGTLLNELGDVVSDIALYLPLVLWVGTGALPVVMVVLLAALTELAGVSAVQIGASRRYEGPMGKSDRAFVFGTLGLLLGSGVPAGPWLDVLLWSVVAATLLTVVNRCRAALAQAGELTS